MCSKILWEISATHFAEPSTTGVFETRPSGSWALRGSHFMQCVSRSNCLSRTYYYSLRSAIHFRDFYKASIMLGPTICASCRSERFPLHGAIVYSCTCVMVINQRSPVAIYIGHGKLQTTDTFTYLWSIICQDGGADIDVTNCTNKAFFRLKPIWRSTVYSRRTKLKLFQSQSDLYPFIWLWVLACNGT